MIFTNSLAAIDTLQFEAVFKQELLQMAPALPLQAALAHSSQVLEGSIEPVVLVVENTPEILRVKTGIFFSGVVAGSCCADDPSPPCEQNEYCEILVVIDKHTGRADITLLDDQDGRGY